MPIYEYECTSCHHHFDLMQKINAEPAKQCPMCFNNSVVKLVSAAGFHLKGTGWYATDFKNKGNPTSSNSSDKKEGAGSASEATTAKDPAPVASETKSTKGDTE